MNELNPGALSYPINPTSSKVLDDYISSKIQDLVWNKFFYSFEWLGSLNITGGSAGENSGRSHGATTTTISDNTFTVVTLNTNDYANGVTWDGTGHKFVVTVAGRYQINGLATYVNGTDQKPYHTAIKINGGATASAFSEASGTGSVGAMVSDIQSLSVGDDISLETWHNAGVNQSLDNDSLHTYLSISLVGAGAGSQYGTWLTAGVGESFSTSNAYLQLITGATNNNFAEVYRIPQIQNIMSFGKIQRFRISFAVNSVTNTESYIVRGDLNHQYYGFKIINNILYGVSSSDGSSETLIAVGTVVANTGYNLEVSFQPNTMITFFVRNSTGVYQALGSLSTNLPLSTGTQEAKTAFADFYIDTAENVSKTLGISYFEYIQDR